MVNKSPRGIASQAPVSPINLGKINIIGIKNNNCLAVTKRGALLPLPIA